MIAVDLSRTAMEAASLPGTLGRSELGQFIQSY